MTSIFQHAHSWTRDRVRDWDTFWFRPVDPAVLCILRIGAGAMLLYTHLVWSIDLPGFFGKHGKISPGFVDAYATPSGWGWSYLSGLESSAALWTVHVLALAILCMFLLGWFTRIVSILTVIITISYVHRASGTLFGLDQINVMLAIYLAIGPCGARYSLDAWWRKRRAGALSEGPPARLASTSANIAVRLIQIHLCIIYLFAGLGKLLGVSWWEGTALWNALANYEYQSIDMLWLAHSPWIINLLTHITLAWEISYAFLIWPKTTRPIMLMLAIPVHLGIALCMGMITFGVVMLIANAAFVPSELVLRVLDRSDAVP